MDRNHSNIKQFYTTERFGKLHVHVETLDTVIIMQIIILLSFFSHLSPPRPHSRPGAESKRRRKMPPPQFDISHSKQCCNFTFYRRRRVQNPRSFCLSIALTLKIVFNYFFGNLFQVILHCTFLWYCLISCKS